MMNHLNTSGPEALIIERVESIDETKPGNNWQYNTDYLTDKGVAWFLLPICKWFISRVRVVVQCCHSASLALIVADTDVIPYWLD